MIRVFLMYILAIASLAILFSGAIVFANKPITADSVLLISAALFAAAKLLYTTIPSHVPET